MRIMLDSREPFPDHPWLPYFSADVTIEVGCLETGDLALATLPDGAVVERKAISDLAGCIGGNRERFERDLRRGRYPGRMIVIVEGQLTGCLRCISVSDLAAAVSEAQRVLDQHRPSEPSTIFKIDIKDHNNVDVHYGARFDFGGEFLPVKRVKGRWVISAWGVWNA